MKKKVIIFRFGSAMPTQKEYSIINEITDGTRRAVGCGTPFGVISIVETSMSPSAITELFDRVAKETGDSLPTIVFEAGGPVGFNFDPDFFANFKDSNDEFDREFGQESLTCTLSLDELLDLVNKKGLTELTKEELQRLKELSK